MEKKKIKIAWVCEFSNPLVREHLAFRSLAFENFCRFLMGKPAKIMADYDQWITNGIEEMKKFGELELHVISFHKYLKREKFDFEHDGVHYHFLKSEDDVRFICNIFRKILKKDTDKDLKYNRNVVKQTLADINPDIIHYFGAENPEYSITSLDVDSSRTPLIVSLQTLMSSPKFKENYPISEELYKYRSGIEKKVLRNATFICAKSALYKEIIRRDINPDAMFFNQALFIAEKINVVKCEKLYDFVYFSANIEKACDLAVEAFIIVASKRRDLKLLVIGDYMPDFKAKMEKRLSDNGLLENVVFIGRLQTHDDVLEGIRKARFALLPLKVDLISGTIREAMASGLPVVTTITPSTPKFNADRESLLISEAGDHQAMAANMMKLLDDENFAAKLAENALITYKEKYENGRLAEDLLKIYKAVFNKDYKDLTC